MTQSRKQAPTQQNRTMGDYNFENEDNFFYLGVNIAKVGNEKDEIRRGIMMPNKSYKSCATVRLRSVNSNAGVREIH